MEEKKDISTVRPIFIRDTDTGEVKYTLEFSRKSVEWAERRGFKFSEVSAFPATQIPLLFFYAFQKNHKGITQQITDGVIEEIGGVTPELLDRLISLYIETLNTLIDTDEDEKKPKNAKFSVEL